MRSLRQILNEDDAVIFVGSGISVWSGLPTWRGLIDRLIVFLDSMGINTDTVCFEAQKGDLLQAASYGFDKLTTHQIGSFIREACQYGIATPHEIHRKIVTLGPRCFITTNYDDLIEQSLRLWKKDVFFPPPVTNRTLSETAEIIHARATNFIFKPHGDAGDIDSIILTREQYRQLLPNGERRSALEALKTLMVTRPVIYIGFSLRDPDFLYIRDMLYNTYSGGVRDHYALMADVSDAEIDYWRKNYGIHLVSYDTRETQNGARDHHALITLLDELLVIDSTETSISLLEKSTGAETQLSLARYAAGLLRAPKEASELQIRVHSEKSVLSPGIQVDKFDNYPVEKFLTSGPTRAILTGLPGAGKSYAFRRATAKLASILQDACLLGELDSGEPVIPILVDLKLYHGSIKDLIDQSLPVGLNFDRLQGAFKLKMFLDAFNEMPREFLENGSYEADFETFVKSVGDHSLIVGSRTSDGVKKLSFPVYDLDQVDEDDISEALSTTQLTFSSTFQYEMKRLISRPFYLRLASNLKGRLPTISKPVDLYKAFFIQLEERFAARWKGEINILKCLSRAAFSALNDGEEAFPTNSLISLVANTLGTYGDAAKLEASELVNWLISENLLIPYTGYRISFAHQSLTEYLAALELAERYTERHGSLDTSLALKRWDQALFITIGLLDQNESRAFIDRVMEADMALAIRSVKYIEFNQDDVVTLILDKIISDNYNDFDFRVSVALSYGFPASAIHEYQIRYLIKHGDSLGSASAQILISIFGDAVKNELLQVMFERPYDFNLCRNGIGQPLRPYATAQDVSTIARYVGNIDAAHSGDLGGMTSGAAVFLGDVSVSLLRSELLAIKEPKANRDLARSIVCEALDDRFDDEAFSLALELLDEGVDRASVTIFFIGRYGRQKQQDERNFELNWNLVTSSHVRKLIAEMGSGENWPHETLKLICEKRPDLASFVKQVAGGRTDVAKLALLKCLPETDSETVFSTLANFLERTEEEIESAHFDVLGEIDVDWRGREGLFVELLRLRNERLASAMLGGTIPPEIEGLGNLEIGEIYWWLDWIQELSFTEGNRYYWLTNQIGACLANHLDHNSLNLFVDEFNKSNSGYRDVLCSFVLPYFSDLSSENLKEEAVSFLLSRLSSDSGKRYLKDSLLGQIATERFVTERLIPLMLGAPEPLSRNLKSTIGQAGDRHGRRYLI